MSPEGQTGDLGDCWQELPMATSRLLLYPHKRDPFPLVFMPPSNFILTSLIFIHLLNHTHPLRNMTPGFQTQFYIKSYSLLYKWIYYPTITLLQPLTLIATLWTLSLWMIHVLQVQASSPTSSLPSCSLTLAILSFNLMHTQVSSTSPFPTSINYHVSSFSYPNPILNCIQTPLTISSNSTSLVLMLQKTS